MPQNAGILSRQGFQAAEYEKTSRFQVRKQEATGREKADAARLPGEKQPV